MLDMTERQARLTVNPWKIRWGRRQFFHLSNPVAVRNHRRISQSRRLILS
jgi:hypothetical protein